MQDPFETVVGKLLARLESGAPRTLVALAGVPGSGKSTLANRLAREVDRRVGQGTIVALGMDGFHYPRSVLSQMPDPGAAFARRGAPWTFDAPALAARLREVKAAAGVRSMSWPDFEHGVGDPVEDAHTVHSAARLVLVEGLYLLLREDPWDRVSAAFDERWFLDTPLDLSLSRLAERHMASWDITRHEAESKIARNDRLNAETVLASRPSSDWVIA